MTNISLDTTPEPWRIERKHWFVALGLAALLHIAIFLRLPSAGDANKAVDPGAQAITIALAPMPSPEPAAKPEPKPNPKPEPKPKPKPSPKPKPKSKPEPAPQPKPQPMPEPNPIPSPEPAPEQSSSPPQPNEQLARAENTAPKPKAGATGGLRDAPPDYRATLAAWLERYKEYPRRARRLGQQGTTVLHFIIDRNGKVLEWDIRSSSGHRLLDDAVENLIRRANPLPAMPDSMTVSKLELTVPVSFALQ